jgi:hypothetical protein
MKRTASSTRAKPAGHRHLIISFFHKFSWILFFSRQTTQKKKRNKKLFFFLVGFLRDDVLCAVCWCRQLSGLHTAGMTVGG